MFCLRCFQEMGHFSKDNKRMTISTLYGQQPGTEPKMTEAGYTAFTLA